jgi:opacity protein-like surface antigen
MRIDRFVAGTMAAIALTVMVATEAAAQADTTRRTTSDQRIPVRKSADAGELTRRVAGGDVNLTTRTRFDSLEALANTYSTRIDSLERANAALVTRLDAMDAHIAALRDSLATVRSEMDALRSEMATVSARADRLADSVVQLNRRFNIFRNRSIFGNSGFYLGLGVTYTAAGLHDMGYVEGLQVTVPIGWHKPGNLIGVRTEWAWQNVDGRSFTGFNNVDPNIYSGTAMLSLHIPFNSAKTHNIYLMGGGGMFMFRDFQPQSSLAAAFAGSQDAPTSETKWGLTAGAGVQFHILGATSLFVQTQWNQVAADRAVAPATTRTLGWVPLVAGLTLR